MDRRKPTVFLLILAHITVLTCVFFCAILILSIKKRPLTAHQFHRNSFFRTEGSSLEALEGYLVSWQSISGKPTTQFRQKSTQNKRKQKEKGHSLRLVLLWTYLCVVSDHKIVMGDCFLPKTSEGKGSKAL